MDRRRFTIILGIAVAVLVLCWWAISTWNWGPSVVIQKRIDSARASLVRQQSDLDGISALESRMARATAHTLGPSTEAVDHALRSRLAELAESAGVKGESVRVSTSAPTTVGTPGRSAFKSASVRELRDEPDFMLVPATITAQGNWDQVTALIDAIRAEPWPHRVLRIRLAARDDGRRIEVSVQLATFFVPDVLPDGGAIKPVKLAVRLDQVNPFAPPYVPPPPPTVDPGKPVVTPPSRWRITHIGLVEGESEVLVQNHSKQRKRLVAGDSIAGLTLVAVERDADGFDVARFRDAGTATGDSWVVEAGAPLRRP